MNKKTLERAILIVELERIQGEAREGAPLPFERDDWIEALGDVIERLRLMSNTETPDPASEDETGKLYILPGARVAQDVYRAQYTRPNRVSGFLDGTWPTFAEAWDAVNDWTLEEAFTNPNENRMVRVLRQVTVIV